MSVVFGIIMPTWNRASVICRSIDSVLQQEYKEFQLIIIDDASEDNTEKVVCNYNSEKIKYIKLAQHKGASACRNIGIETLTTLTLTTDLVMYLDSDDIIYDNCLTVLEASFNKEKWKAAYGCIDVIKDNRKISCYDYPFKREKLLLYNYIPNVAFTHDIVLSKTVHWNEELNRLQDWDYWCQLVECVDFTHIDCPLGAIYRDTENSISKIDIDNKWYNQSLAHIRRKYSKC